MTAIATRPRRRAPVALLALQLASCTLLGVPRPEAPQRLRLDPPPAVAAEPAADPRTVSIAVPAARAGFESARMAYVTRAHELRFFAHHEWVAPPARMLAPLLADALERTGRFRASIGPAGAGGDLRLETEIVALEQDFTESPSRARLAIRAELIDAAARRSLGAARFEAVESTPSDDPYGGVVAANRAAARVLEDLARWCASAAGAAAR